MEQETRRAEELAMRISELHGVPVQPRQHLIAAIFMLVEGVHEISGGKGEHSGVSKCWKLWHLKAK